MDVKPKIYESLTPKQRIAAVIEAMAREDETEIKRLNDTCKMKSYRQRDISYSDVMTRLMGMSLALEADLRGMAIEYLTMDVSLGEEICLQKMVVIEMAWTRLLDDLGIDKPSMLNAGAPRHYMVKALLKNANDRAVPDEDDVVRNLELMKEYIKA